jgi:hypothetical protein
MLARIIGNDVLAWLLLSGTTLLSWLIFTETHAQAIAYTIILLSSTKVYLVGVSFMEVFEANPIFIKVFHMWVALLTVLFWWAY